MRPTGATLGERSPCARNAAIAVPATKVSIAGHATTCSCHVAAEYSVVTHRSGITSASYTRLRADPQKSTMAWSRVCDRQLAMYCDAIEDNGRPCEYLPGRG